MKSINELVIIEVASVLAGPSVGQFFAELGAKVIKVENKNTGGDVTRQWRLPKEDKTSSVSAYFCAVNAFKEHLFLDFNLKKDLHQLYELIQKADVFISNFKHGDDLKFGLDYSHLSQLNPKLLYGAISGFGDQSDRVAYDLILQAESGFMSMNGTPDSGPIKMPVALIDILAGHQLKEGILVALYELEINGKGQKVSVSLYDTAVASLANQATNWLMNHHVAKPIGSQHPNIAPYGEFFSTKDNRIITFAVGSDQQFTKLCRLLKLDHLPTSDLFSTNVNRVKNRTILAKSLQNKISLLLADSFLDKCHKNHIPVGEIKSIDQVFNDANAQELIISEMVGQKITKRVKTVVFKNHEA